MCAIRAEVSTCRLYRCSLLRIAYPPLSVTVLGRVLHLEHALPTEAIVGRRLDAGRAGTVDGFDAAGIVEGDLIRAQLHHRAVPFMQLVDGGRAAAGQLDDSHPFAGQRGQERPWDGARDRGKEDVANGLFVRSSVGQQTSRSGGAHCVGHPPNQRRMRSLRPEHTRQAHVLVMPVAPVKGLR